MIFFSCTNVYFFIKTTYTTYMFILLGICLIGGPWEYYDASDIFDWEGSRVVAVTTGTNYCTLEMVTRAKTDLIITIFGGNIWITQKTSTLL